MKGRKGQREGDLRSLCGGGVMGLFGRCHWILRVALRGELLSSSYLLFRELWDLLMDTQPGKGVLTTHTDFYHIFPKGKMEEIKTVT